MGGHWFLVASQKTARIYTEVSDRNRLRQLKELDNPLGRERKRVLIRKQAGEMVKSLGRGLVRYSENKRHDPHEEAALQFAREVANFLKSEHRQMHFRSLTVVAEPHFYGKLKDALEPKFLEHVTEWIKKDLLKTPKKELVHFLLPTKN